MTIMTGVYPACYFLYFCYSKVLTVYMNNTIVLLPKSSNPDHTTLN